MIGLSSNSISQLLHIASIELEDAGIENAKLDARLLLQAAGEFSRTYIASNRDGMVESAVELKFLNFIEKRKSGKPVYRIIGKREFYGREFSVFDDVLDPRPETELLVERVLEDWTGQSPSFIEIGVGSGAICVSLLAEIDGARCLGTDISNAAIGAAQANAKSIGVDGRLELVEGDCLSGIDGKYDFIVSNPPYVSCDEMLKLPIEVREHDPHISLEAGREGLDFYVRIFDEAKGLLNSEGRLYLETGHGQHDLLIAMGSKKGWGLVSKHLDLSGLERIVVFEESAN